MANSEDAAPQASTKSPSPTAAVTNEKQGAKATTVASRGQSTRAGSEPTPPAKKMRRRIIWSCVWGFLAANFFMFLRFFFPRALFEPSTVFRIGYPSDFGLGVEERFKQQYRIWVVREATELYVIYARCTHLGCTPDWKATEKKFKCPCHGSGYTPEGINFEGPAPRPMDRAHVERDAEGQIVVDTSKLYTDEHFNDAGAYISV